MDDSQSAQFIVIPESVSEIFEKINELRVNPFKMANKLTQMMSYINKRDNTLQLPNSQPLKLQEGIKGFEETITFLKETEPLDPLIWNEEISKIAQSHCNDIGSKGLIQHDSSDKKLLFEDRFRKYGTYTELEECIEFGSNDATLIIANLLVCDGDLTRKNRKIILSNTLRHLGIGLGNHIKYNTVVVLDLIRNWKKRICPSGKNKLNVSTVTTETNFHDLIGQEDIVISNNFMPLKKLSNNNKEALIQKYEKEFDEDDSNWFDDCLNKKEAKQIIEEGDKIKIIKNTSYNFENGSKRRVIVSKTWKMK